MADHDHVHDEADHEHIVGDDAASWDARYADAEGMWSGHPNEAVVTEASQLEPGRALDVGCGEGADAMWLAEAGWDVVALDISQVAVQRAAMASSQRDLPVTWMVLDMTQEAPEPGVYDLVSAPYLPIRIDAGEEPLRRLLDAVAPGGRLLWVAHHLTEDAIAAAREEGWDPTEYHDTSAVRALLTDGWHVELDEVRPVTREGAHHVADIVLRARRAA